MESLAAESLTASRTRRRKETPRPCDRARRGGRGPGAPGRLPPSLPPSLSLSLSLFPEPEAPGARGPGATPRRRPIRVRRMDSLSLSLSLSFRIWPMDASLRGRSGPRSQRPPRMRRGSGRGASVVPRGAPGAPSSGGTGAPCPIPSPRTGPGDGPGGDEANGRGRRVRTTRARAEIGTARKRVTKAAARISLSGPQRERKRHAFSRHGAVKSPRYSSARAGTGGQAGFALFTVMHKRPSFSVPNFDAKSHELGTSVRLIRCR